MHTEDKSSHDEAKRWHAKEETESYKSHVIWREWDGHSKNNHQDRAANAHHFSAIPIRIVDRK